MADGLGPAIRRASRAARAEMHVLDTRTEAELTRVYTEAADQVRAQIAAAGDGMSLVRLTALRELLARVQVVLDALAQHRTAVLEDAIQRAAELGVRPLTAEGLLATGRTVAVAAPLDGAQALRAVDGAVRFVTAFRAEDGLALSDRLWNVDRGAADGLLRSIEQAVVQGWSADKAAQDFLMRGQPVPPGSDQARQAASVANVLRGADLLADPAAGALASTLRVMRTEVNRAHGEAYMDGAARADGVVGFRFLLSPRHPRPDVCDLLARQNLHGLGAGVYPDRKSTPWPAHPNTLSFVVAVFEDEVTDVDRAGRETTNEALARMAPELRAGVLGPTKAGYFDQGLLSRGMVRSRVRDVQQRLRRQGKLAHR